MQTEHEIVPKTPSLLKFNCDPHRHTVEDKGQEGTMEMEGRGGRGIAKTCKC